MIKLGLLTTWNTRCGIAEYSAHLARALERQGEVTVTVLGSRNHGDLALKEYEDGALPVFEVQAWTPRLDYSFDVDAVLDRDLDVLHIQYSNVFFHRRPLIELMRRFPGVVALTYHDKVVPSTFPYRLADLLYSHREDVGLGPRRIIPQGIDVRPPLVKTFGLGKSRDDLIEEVCARNGWRFEASFGLKRWLTDEELYEWLRDADAIVLWYPDDPTSGGSAAAPRALSTRRPVIVNDTQWFSDLPDRVPGLRKARTPDQLEATLHELFDDSYIGRRSWDAVARRLGDDYREALSVQNQATSNRGHAARARLFVAADPKPWIASKRRLLRQTPAEMEAT